MKKIPWNKGKKGLQVAWNKNKRGFNWGVKGKRHYLFAGNKRVEYNGYITVWIGGKRIPEHRHKIQTKIGRKLKKYEYVHHIDGNPANNKLINLLIVSPKEHRAIHNKDNKYYKLRKHTCNKVCYSKHK